MKMRFDHTWKSDCRARARLVLQGFSDPDLETQRSDAPTISRRGRMLFYAACARYGFSVEKGDVVGAFLQGTASEEHRHVFGLPPPELLQAMGLDGDKWLVQVLKPGYGLTVAPRRWWQNVCCDMASLGLSSCVLEPCLLILRGPDHRVLGMVVVHVDDFMFGGDLNSNLYRDFRTALGK